MQTQIFMKTIFLAMPALVVLLIAAPDGVMAQGTVEPLQPNAQSVTTKDDQPAYTVRERGAHHRVWDAVTTTTDRKGRTRYQTNSVTELAAGMNFLNEKGEWEESSETIEILPNNKGAAASKGQHKVIFPPDVYDGQIEMNLPDGRWLVSRVLGLSYFDTRSGKSVLIAEIKNSEGVVHGSNVVIYADAFTDFQADLRYSYTREIFEQDVILRSMPPLPEDFGLNPDTTRLQVLTEFFNPPVPTKEGSVVVSKSGDQIADQRLDFGSVQMGLGKAFSQELEGDVDVAPVSKQWEKMEGRDFLIEEVQFNDILPSLEKLSKNGGASLQRKSVSTNRLASIKRQLPSTPRLASKPATKTIKQAMAAQPKGGLVLDYVTINTSLANYTFANGSTYYLSGNVTLTGTNSTFEGGTVLKYASGVSLTVNTPVTWTGDMYRPVVLTAKDDNSVGETISGSSGNPGSTYYAANALYFDASTANTNLVIQYLRVRNATKAVSINTKSGHDLKHVQMINCANGLALTNAEVSLRNALMNQVLTNFTGSSSTSHVEHLTVNISSRFNQNIGADLFVTNSLLVLVTNLGTFSSVSNATNTATSGIFQTVFAGNHYLANGSTNRNAGSTNINATLLADLKRLTTYPPLIYSNVFIAANTTLNPQAQRDTDLPDIGYHYDPLDYVVTVTVTNGVLTLANGVCVTPNGRTTGISVIYPGSLVSSGSPTALNWVAFANTFQEQINSRWDGTAIAANSSSVPPSFRFTSWSAIGVFGYHFNSSSGSGAGGVTLADCQFSGNYFNAVDQNVAITNCVFDCANVYLDNSGSKNTTLFNNTFRRATFRYDFYDVTSGSGAFDNLFDITTINYYDYAFQNMGYNAYSPGNGKLLDFPASDFELTSKPVYQTGALGRYYAPSSEIVDTGSRTAAAAGLYHYTTQTDQSKDSSTVDVGFHYVAVDEFGNPIDSDGDGTPDYLEDANGNGTVESGETDWQSGTDAGLRVLITEPKRSANLP